MRLRRDAVDESPRLGSTPFLLARLLFGSARPGSGLFLARLGSFFGSARLFFGSARVFFWPVSGLFFGSVRPGSGHFRPRLGLDSTGPGLARVNSARVAFHPPGQAAISFRFRQPPKPAVFVFLVFSFAFSFVFLRSAGALCLSLYFPCIAVLY